ncbi:lectin, mannose binding 1 S homeolog precursor [Xenopus laevis]|uniref:Lectin, mannose binding 1 S homeolog precursor n=2 Tax=Xenopus laevis TaxID=8355 RepID=A0A8J0PR82_XENLA|nr:lectin, mannose binding 1 S homeolog precursor [Xenopus laevis]
MATSALGKMAVHMQQEQLRVATGLRSLLFLWLLSLVGANEGQAAQDTPHRRFEYKYSFKGPYLVQSDGTVPFWSHSGNAIPSADQIRITPSLKSQKGSVWTKTLANFQNWELEVTFRITGRGRIGADGLAIWFTAAQGLDGDVYGASDSWNGVGIFFDSFDNDGKKNNPAILVVGNNGKLVYDHQNDGSTQALASCLRDFRNKPYPVRAKITYYKKILTVMINSGFTPDKEDYEFCAKVDNMVLPSQGYFGMSAATGGLADDHDVLSFLTFQLTEPGKEAPPPDAEIPKEEKDKYQEEFDNFQQELDKRKEEFQKDHPEANEQPVDDLYESVNEREVRQIFEGQNRIHLEIKQLNRQLDMILDEQRRYVTAVTDEIAKKGTGDGAGGTGHQPQFAPADLNFLLSTQREVIQQMAEMRNSVSETVRLLSGNKPHGSAGYETTQHFNDIKEHLHVVKRDVEHLVHKSLPQDVQKCPDVPPFPSCLTTTHFIVFVAIQTILFFGYIMYRSQQEAAAKKFF